MTMEPANINLKITKRFFNEVYMKYMYNQPLGQKRIMVFYGGAGSGKSKFVVQNALLKGLSEKRKFLVCRKVDNTIRDSIFAEFVQGLRELNIYEICDIKNSYLTITLPNGTEYIFKGLEDPERIKSIQGISDIIMEEATEFTIDDYSQLNLRLRNKAIKNNQITLMYNPASKANWVYGMFHDPKKPRPKNCQVVHTTYKDNRFLSADYLENLKDMMNTNPVYYEIYALGKFASLGKMVYTNWTRGSLDIMEELKTGKWKPKFGIDFGFSNDPTVIISILVNEEEKKIYVFDEFYKTGMFNRQIFEVLKKKNLLGYHMFADSAAPKDIAEIKRLGARYLKPAKKGKDSINHGIQFLQGYKIIVDHRCKHTIEEFENYGWKKIKGTNEYENKPMDNFNHCMDALRYAVSDMIPRNTVRTINKSLLGL